MTLCSTCFVPCNIDHVCVVLGSLMFKEFDLSIFKLPINSISDWVSANSATGEFLLSSLANSRSSLYQQPEHLIHVIKKEIKQALSFYEALKIPKFQNILKTIKLFVPHIPFFLRKWKSRHEVKGERFIASFISWFQNLSRCMITIKNGVKILWPPPLSKPIYTLS